MATKEQLAKIPLKQEHVPLPELGDGVTVLVSELDGRAYEQLEEADYPANREGKPTFQWSGHRARWIAACVRNDDGTPMYTTADLPQVETLPEHVKAALFKAARRLNGHAQAEETASETAAKN
jgi:hypothetical protein